MNSVAVIDALSLPAETRVNQRVPKKLLTENGAPTAADKRHIQEGMEELVWVASLKPNNIGVPAFRDESHDYLEIAVLVGTLRLEAKASRLTELIHRAIPYPVVLVVTSGASQTLSLAHKRLSQGEAGKVVLEDTLALADLSGGTVVEANFLKTLPLATQPQKNLFALYQGWLDCITALAASRLTGVFALAGTPEESSNCRHVLYEHAQLESELALLRTQASKALQISHRVELNLLIQQREAQLLKLTRHLTPTATP